MKNVYRLLLLVLFAFGGCEMFNQTIDGDSDECTLILASFEDKFWDVLEDGYALPSTFAIKYGITTYVHIIHTGYTLEYTEGGYDWATYEGDVNGDKIRVEMTNITTSGTMNYTRYKNGLIDVTKRTAEIYQ